MYTSLISAYIPWIYSYQIKDYGSNVHGQYESHRVLIHYTYVQFLNFSSLTMIEKIIKQDIQQKFSISLTKVRNRRELYY
jgi:hypothetical protein